MTATIFCIIWACLSILTSLITEAIKKFISDDFPSNIIALIVAIVTGAGVTTLYYLQVGISFTPLNVAYIGAIAILNWVGAMVGYDKVKEAIIQLTGVGEDDDEETVIREDEDRSDEEDE